MYFTLDFQGKKFGKTSMGTFNKYVGSDEVAGVFKYPTCTSLTCKFQVDLQTT